MDYIRQGTCLACGGPTGCCRGDSSTLVAVPWDWALLGDTIRKKERECEKEITWKTLQNISTNPFSESPNKRIVVINFRATLMEDCRSGVHFLGLSDVMGIYNDSALLNFNPFLVYLKPHDLSEINNSKNIDYLFHGSHRYQTCGNTESPCFQRALQPETLISYLSLGILSIGGSTNKDIQRLS